MWSRCGPLYKSPRRHVLSARKRDTENGLGNLSVCPVWAPAFQNAQFSTSIYREKPAADHTPWLLIHVELLSVIKKRVWRLQANSFYLLQKLCLKICDIWLFLWTHLNTQHSLPSMKYLYVGISTVKKRNACRIVCDNKMLCKIVLDISFLGKSQMWKLIYLEERNSP